MLFLLDSIIVQCLVQCITGCTLSKFSIFIYNNEWTTVSECVCNCYKVDLFYLCVLIEFVGLAWLWVYKRCFEVFEGLVTLFGCPEVSLCSWLLTKYFICGDDLCFSAFVFSGCSVMVDDFLALREAAGDEDWRLKESLKLGDLVQHRLEYLQVRTCSRSL